MMEIFNIEYNTHWPEKVKALSDEVRKIILNDMFYVVGKGMMIPCQDYYCQNKLFDILTGNRIYI